MEEESRLRVCYSVESDGGGGEMVVGRSGVDLLDLPVDLARSRV